MQTKIMDWLRSFSGLEKLTAEWLGELPGCAGLFYQGEQVVSRTVDILGNAILRKRLRWKIVSHGKPVTIDPTTAPQLGLLQTVQVEKSHLDHMDEMEIPRWETELTVEYTAVQAEAEVADEKL